MVKYFFIFYILIGSIQAEDHFERHCVSCHQGLPISLQEMFKQYLLVYSGEVNVKAALNHYLQHPLRDISVMSKLFKDTYGVKDKTSLSPEALEKMIDIYWDKYKVFNKLK